MSWETTLRERLDRHTPPGTHAVSIKVRATSGCFHCRGCNPHMSRVIDDAARRNRDETYRFEEHETGPEWIVYLALGTAGITLAKSLIDLVTTIVKARAEGKAKGDKGDAPIEVIVRGFDADGKLFDEKVLKFNAGESATREVVERALLGELRKQLPAPTAEPPPTSAPPVVNKPNPQSKAKRKPKRGRSK